MLPYEIVSIKEGDIPNNTFSDLKNDKGEVVGVMCIPNYYYKFPEGTQFRKFTSEVTGRDENGNPNKWVWNSEDKEPFFEGATRIISPRQF